MFDPGLSLKATTLEAAWTLLETGVRDKFSPGGKPGSDPNHAEPGSDPTDAVDAV